VSSGNSEMYHGSSSSSGDDQSAYDKLNRLTGFRRGTLSSSGNNVWGLDTVSSASRSQSWSLDALGNMPTVTTDGTPVSRTHNDGNQLTDVGGTGLEFDANGN